MVVSVIIHNPFRTWIPVCNAEYTFLMNRSVLWALHIRLEFSSEITKFFSALCMILTDYCIVDKVEWNSDLTHKNWLLIQYKFYCYKNWRWMRIIYKFFLELYSKLEEYLNIYYKSCWKYVLHFVTSGWETNITSLIW